MKKIGLFKGMILCSRYQKMNQIEQKEVQQQRLKELVDFAKTNSPYLKEKYKDLKPDFKLSDIPTSNKLELMHHFDDWITDRDVHMKDLEAFIKDLDNIGRKFHNKYLVFTTSGSTGNPLVSLCDPTTNNIMGAVNTMRAITRKQDARDFMKHGGKTIGIFANEGFYLGNSSVRSRLLSMPWKKKQMAVTSALYPVPQIVEELNTFQPAMLGGYPTVLELLIDEKLSGRLKINPVFIMTGGEYLSEELRKRLSDTFHCYVQTSYSCTEGGSVACECTNHHFHVNDDWLIIEPVDQDNRPVPDGTLSDKILMTNLYNYTQPYIRYEVTDRVVMSHEPCGCGNRSPWLTLEGRTDDVVPFTEENRTIRVAPLAIYACLKEVHSLQRFQILVHSQNQVEFRIVPKNDTTKEEAFKEAEKTLKEYLETHGVHHIECYLSTEEPKQHPKSGKFKHIINQTEPEK